MANVVFYIRTKFIKIEEKKKETSNIVTSSCMVTSRTIVKKILHF